MHPPEDEDVPAPRLQNIVATFRFSHPSGRRFDLNEIVANVPEMEARRPHASATIRLKTPKSTFLIFASGSSVCAGTKTREEAERAGIACLRFLRKMGLGEIDVKFIGVQNIVATAHCGFSVDLQKLQARLQGNCDYEKSLFPGLRWASPYPSRSPSVKFAIFHSGRCNIVGANRECDVVHVWKCFYLEHVRHVRTQTIHPTSGVYRSFQDRFGTSANLGARDQSPVRNYLGTLTRAAVAGVRAREPDPEEEDPEFGWSLLGRSRSGGKGRGAGEEGEEEEIEEEEEEMDERELLALCNDTDSPRRGCRPVSDAADGAGKSGFGSGVDRDVAAELEARAGTGYEWVDVQSVLDRAHADGSNLRSSREVGVQRSVRNYLNRVADPGAMVGPSAGGFAPSSVVVRR